MCGVIGYTGHGSAAGHVLEALARLEYRGYDSAGIGLLDDGRIDVVGAVRKARATAGEDRRPAAARQHRSRAHPLGDPRGRHRGGRAPAAGGRPRRDRAPRDRREHRALRAELEDDGYGIARGRGLDVDLPRNLAKTVTVE